MSTVQTQTLTAAVPDVTFWPRPPRKAVTQISTDQVATRAGVDAYTHFTLVGVQLAGPASPSRRAEAAVTSRSLLTCCTTSTRTPIALPHRISAGVSGPAVRTDAAEARWVFHTGGSVHTRGRQTRMFHDVTVASSETFLALTLVLVWLCVGAGPAVFTGQVGATVVQIFVTQQSSPVDIAHTLPGFGAASIHTPGERHTLVTQRAFPAIMTLAFSRYSTGAVHLMTPLLAHRFFALRSRPALHADLGAAGVTVEVAEEVITGPAEFVAERSVVVRITAEAKPVLQAESPSMVAVRLPLFTGV